MNKNSILTLFFLGLLGLVSCVPQNGGSANSTQENGIAEDTDNPASDPDFSSNEDIYWFQSSGAISKTITLNENTTTRQFLQGEDINSFLKATLSGTTINYDRTYCLIASFNVSGAQKNLRFRAVPQAISNFSTSEKEYVLQIDFNDKETSQSACDGTALFITSTPDAASSVGDADAAFAPAELCPTCSGILTSSDISLYLASDPIVTANRIPASSLSLANIVLRINSASTTPVDNPSCSQGDCSAKGFDCCLDGQCVNDGELRPNASLQSDFPQAISDVAADSDHFVNWPNIYFVCGSAPVVDPVDPEPTDPQSEAEKELQEMIERYNCLAEGEKDTPDYVGENVCLPGLDQATYESIRSDVWKICGCSADPFPTDPSDPVCPNYGLELVTNNSGETVRVDCRVIPEDNDDTPFTNATVVMSSRSAPHRFYRADNGESVDDISTLDSTVTQEGDSFQYQDTVNKALPTCGATQTTCSDNFNSITGQMTVDLSQARPAHALSLDYDQSYIIHTVSGSYTPCPQCDEDSWFDDFVAFPSTTGGAGLSGLTYSTNRSEYSNNLSRGNFEDTIFGRACYLPPTMIPYSHKAESNVITQRQNRLLTQASLYINGYQKDWYGFNLGALIGSFDGVSWFAIGSSPRRITAKSDTLYLAINSPFADLATTTQFVVNVNLDNGGTFTPSYDYDPTYDFDNTSFQNTGASCQRWHQCETDTDCITSLGWEYMCADTGQIRTAWPKFDEQADEEVLEEFANANFNRILTAGFSPGSRKRCVYRGAGALCKRNFTSGVDNNKQRLLACAPGFHCAHLNSSSFNNEINRSVANVSALLYGREADILGRPKNYVAANGILSDVAKTNIRHSGAYYTSDVTDLGLCRPGKRADLSTYIDQHSQKDTVNRVDYINQIGSCNSSATGTNRTLSCPQIQMEDGGSETVGNLILSVDATNQQAQNSCGSETQYLSGAIALNSFASIELGTFPSVIVSPTLAADSCKRRAGQVCHTDLDCSPNRLYAEEAQKLGVSFFGGTLAEKSYWEEALVCSQANPRPRSTDADYKDYDMSLNRCCRETGQDFTMYTEGDSSTSTDNPNLSVVTYPHDSPTTDGRYSRYASSGAVDGTTNPAQTLAPFAQAPIVDHSSGTMPKAFQWKTFNETGENTCCGGGWVRKFADSTNDWSRSNRVSIPASNLACLNYRTDNFESPVDGVDQNNWDTYQAVQCFSPADDGCIEQGFSQTGGVQGIIPPTLNSGLTTATLITKPLYTPESGRNPGMGALSLDTPYEPIAYPNSTQINTADNNYYTYFRDRNTYPAVSFYLPAYIGYDGALADNIVSVRFLYFNADGSPAATASSNPTENAICAVTINPGSDLGVDEYCLTQVLGRWVFHGHADTISAWDYGAVEITYNVQNGSNYVYTTGLTDASQISFSPGNEYYYLTKLARFELLGVPQIVYEPLFCNSNRDKLVDGLFDLPAPTRSNFYDNSHVMDTTNLAVNGRPLAAMYNEDLTVPVTTQSGSYDSNGDAVADLIDPAYLWDPPPVVAPYSYTENQERFVFDDKVNLPQVFSSHEFRCCAKLGQSADSDARCCSGNRDDEGICKLPSKANLHVYFNKFITSEGMGSDQPGGGLTDNDFIPETGEPKLSNSVQTKIRNLGEAYCESGEVRSGGAFGFYRAGNGSSYFIIDEDIPNNDDSIRKYSIVDSTRDEDVANESGYNEYSNGYRWDHQLYCR